MRHGKTISSGVFRCDGALKLLTIVSLILMFYLFSIFRDSPLSFARNFFKQPSPSSKCKLHRINGGVSEDKFQIGCTVFRCDIFWFRGRSE